MTGIPVTEYVLNFNTGPRCSSIGMGAFKEIGLLGVMVERYMPDNSPGTKVCSLVNLHNLNCIFILLVVVNEALVHNDAVANILFIECPVGVGFSYSNTTDEYMSSGDNMTAEDMYNFLRKWFERYPMFKGRDFFMTGESYADSTPMMNLKGIKIGNGLLDDVSDTRGAVNFAWIHALVPEDTRNEFLLSCASESRYEDEACNKAYETLLSEIGDINYFNIYSPSYEPAFMNVTGGPYDLLYVVSYLNQPEVQVAIHANTTGFPYTWAPCRLRRGRKLPNSASSSSVRSYPTPPQLASQAALRRLVEAHNEQMKDIHSQLVDKNTELRLPIPLVPTTLWMMLVMKVMKAMLMKMLPTPEM
ncbi:serine carboxypeptidase-like protein 26, partial [Tanacetum coccineum]